MSFQRGKKQNSPEYRSVKAAVDKVLSGKSKDPTGGAPFFDGRIGSFDKWNKKKRPELTQKVGNHYFFRAKPENAPKIKNINKLVSQNLKSRGLKGTGNILQVSNKPSGLARNLLISKQRTKPSTSLSRPGRINYGSVSKLANRSPSIPRSQAGVSNLGRRPSSNARASISAGRTSSGGGRRSANSGGGGRVAVSSRGGSNRGGRSYGRGRA